MAWSSLTSCQAGFSLQTTRFLILGWGFNSDQSKSGPGIPPPINAPGSWCCHTFTEGAHGRCSCLAQGKTAAPRGRNLFPLLHHHLVLLDDPPGSFALAPTCHGSAEHCMGGWFLLTSFNSCCYKGRLTAAGEASAFAPLLSPPLWASCLLQGARFVLLKVFSRTEGSSHALCPGHP